MTREALALIVGIILPIALHAQPTPDFSGVWTLDDAKSDRPGGRSARGAGGRGMPGLAGPITIRQTHDEITIGLATYKLDGSPTTIEGRGGTATARARWDGTTLVIETSREIQKLSLRTKEVRALSADGKEMTVVHSADGPQGPILRRMVFTKP